MPNIARNSFWAMPGTLLSIAISIGFVFSAAMTVLAMMQPHYAERLVLEQDRVLLYDTKRQAVGELAPPVAVDDTPIRPEPGDLTPDPDVIDSYDAQARFFARQDAFARWLAEPGQDTVPVIGDGRLRTQIPLTPSRSLPFEFWLQILVGFAIFVVSAWIWALQPRALANRLFGIAGAGVWISATTAALYSTRWLALPSSLFVPLSAMNVFGAMTYGVAMICLFLIYPVRMIPNRLLAVVAAFFGGWFLLGQFDALGSPANEGPLLTATEMLAILLLVAVQFFRSRKKPLERAAIRWVGVSTLIGSGLFICTVVIPVLLGLEPLIGQSYAFAFFLIVHLGVAFGLRRNALFQSERWAIGMFRAVSFGLLLIAVDIALITLLGSISSAAVLTMLLLLPFFYLPWRGLVQRWLLGNRRIEDLLEEVAHIALIGDVEQRVQQWRGIFEKAFSPLQIDTVGPGASAKVDILEDGIALQLPAVIDCPALLVRYKNSGTRLFQERDRQLATRLIDLASSLKRQQEAFKQGVSTERSRISRDLHDDLSARLVSGLMLEDPGELKAVLRASLAEVRTIVSTEEGGSGQLVDILADSRAEAAERLEAAGIELSWPVADISGHMSPQSQKALASVLREIVTNVVKHSGAGRLSVRTRLENARLYLVASDDGANFNGTLKQGNGLKNMRARLAAIDGYFDFDGEAGSGFRVSINVPVIS
ncbi:hypothetical protein MB02_02930 [Croceicoccus estronivorus]|uniref:sensor histidine kinase n=1 Tax=Croceicoccus estronivorus TaxID=1172626 RepID=UPI00082BF3CC|nr:sensor histidine kinase [Croceicoccus estronivorus]OCC25599.1 hypothetical protein MB02_02930 [Croceicoccus estronivorus]